MEEIHSDCETSENGRQVSSIVNISRCIGQCERIHQTIVPLIYALHSLQSITVWLLTVPLVLVKDFGSITGPVLPFMVCFLC